MLPITAAKVRFFWIATLVGCVLIGLWKLRVFGLPDGIAGFLEGFTSAMAVAAILTTAHRLRTGRTAS